MSQPVLAHLFGALLTLERGIEELNKLLPEREVDQAFHGELEQVGRVIAQMRVTANNLQLQIAQHDWEGTTRSLEMFYGLNSMVKPELISLFQRLRSDASAARTLDEAVRSELH